MSSRTPCWTVLTSCQTVPKKSWTCDQFHTFAVSDMTQGVGVILDNGCKRNVGGSQWRKSVQEMLATYGLKGHRVEVQEEFLFGSDRVDTSLCAWEYPAGIHGTTGYINIAEIKSNCPGLLSSGTMGELDITIQTRPKTYDIGSIGVKDYKHENTPSGHALLRIDWFGNLDKLPSRFWLEGDRSLGVRKGVAQRLRKAANFVSALYESKPPEVIEAGNDAWEITETALIRHHKTPRQHLFVPYDVQVPYGVDISSLAPSRQTHLFFSRFGKEVNV